MATQFPCVEWAAGTTVYEVNLRQYSAAGNLKAFAEHLPRLREMGIGCLWFMPITPIAETKRQGSLGSYYACSSYTQVGQPFGSLADFKEVVAAAHALGMKVILDWVANHTGGDHEWMAEHPDWFVRDEAGNFTERNGWVDVVDLNFDQPEMREALLAAMVFWVKETGIDGFRCDMAHLVPLDFWETARKTCDAIKPLFWLAECEDQKYHAVFDATYAWWWMHENEKLKKGEGSLARIREVLHAYTQYPSGSIKLYFTSNHDENSWNGTEYEKYGKAALAWAVFCFTWQGMPLVYSGQEAPLKRRLKFFDKDPIEWPSTLALAPFYQKLAGLKSSSLALQKGETFVLPTGEDQSLFLFLRRWEQETVLVLLHLGEDKPQKFTVQHAWLTGRFEQVFSGLSYVFEGQVNFELLPGDYLVYRSVGA